jgi:thiosulfate dehydrogenase [quinone] large subunit
LIKDLMATGAKAPAQQTTPRKGGHEMSGLTRSRAFGLLALRLTIGWVFLYAGIEKIFGAEPFSAVGYLKFGTIGTTAAQVAEGTIVNPTHQFWVDMAGNAALMNIVNFLVPFGQVAIGLALILGLATRFAAVMGTIMMTAFWISGWDFAFGVIEYHSVLAIATAVLGLTAAGEVYGLDALVDDSPIVKRTPALRYVLG